MAVAVIVVVIVAGHNPNQQANAASVPAAEPPPVLLLAAPTPPPPNLPTPNTVTAPVKDGDNLAKIFHRHGYDAGDLQRLLDSGPHGRRLKSIHPDHEFVFTADDDGSLLHLTYRLNRLESVDFRRIGNRFEAIEMVREPDRIRTYRVGKIDHSLFVACDRIGLSDAFAMRLAEIFQWDIDFILDVRSGDEFHVLYEEHHVDGEFVGHGEILAAEFINTGRSYQAVRYTDANGFASYFAPDGGIMRKAFLRAPLGYTRVSSSFNLKRIHPLWKSAMPHRGIDYAAPTGTRVKAAGDGKIVAKSRTATNGNFVVIQHGQRYQTKYLHLSRFASNLTVGDQVSQGAIIGRVGATGWATGPHLHYEFLVDGVHKNPSTVSLPEADPITLIERAAFHTATTPLLADLQNRKTDTQVTLQNVAR